GMTSYPLEVLWARRGRSSPFGSKGGETALPSRRVGRYMPASPFRTSAVRRQPERPTPGLDTPSQIGYQTAPHERPSERTRTTSSAELCCAPDIAGTGATRPPG